jgi:hypothetical protein
MSKAETTLAALKDCLEARQVNAVEARNLLARIEASLARKRKKGEVQIAIGADLDVRDKVGKWLDGIVRDLRWDGSTGSLYIHYQVYCAMRARSGIY